MSKKKQFTQCPNLDCQANWGVEEIDFQECDSCGWPNCDNEENETFEEQFIEYDDFDNLEDLKDEMDELPF